MDINEFLRSFEDLLQTDEILTKDTILEDLEEWDSLSKMATMAFLDKNFNYKSTINELKEFITIGDIATKVGVL